MPFTPIFLSTRGRVTPGLSASTMKAQMLRVLTRGRVAGLGEDDEPVGLHPARDPALRAVEHEAVSTSVGRCVRAHPRDVGSGARLAETERRALRALGDARQVPLLLLLVARDHDRAGRQSGQQQHESEHVGVLGDLLDGERRDP